MKTFHLVVSKFKNANKQEVLSIDAYLLKNSERTEIHFGMIKEGTFHAHINDVVNKLKEAIEND